MKKYRFLVLLVSLVFISSDMPHYGKYTAVLMDRSALNMSVKSISPVPLINPGKIYLKGDYIYIIEKYKGVHVINNTDATKPIKEKFITIPGIVDVAIKNNYLYADNAIDLVAVDISDLASVRTVQRKRNVFPELSHPDWGYIPSEYNMFNRPKNTVIVEWRMQ